MSRTDAVVAVVDDEASVRTMLGRVLRLADYRVTAFASGEDFLSSLASQAYVCAVVDLHMPGLTGLQVQARLRVTNMALPVVFITASDDVALDQAVLEAGGTCLLRKPFSSDELLAAIGAATAGAS
jgi:FixJ family two-component response regulator